MTPSHKFVKKLPAEFSFTATGTQWTIQTVNGPASSVLKGRVADTVEAFEKTFSRFRADSLLQQLATQPGTYNLPDYASGLLELYVNLEQLTNGAFTPLIGKNLAQAGYDASYRLTPATLSANPRLEQVVQITGNVMRTHAPVQLDFGAAAKGLLVDRLSHLLSEQSDSPYTINAGGDIYTSRPIAVGLEHPDHDRRLVGKIHLTDGALCGSSSNRRDWGAYHHIINAQTLQSPRTIRATWVHAASCMMADALATALYVAPIKKLKQYDFEYAIMYTNGQTATSPLFNGGFFETD